MRYHFRFMARRRLFMGLSGLLLAITVVSLIVQGLNFGVDFAGGVVLDYCYPKTVSVSQVRSVAASSGLSSATIQQLGSNNGCGAGYVSQYVVSTTPIPDSQRLALTQAMTKTLGGEQISLNEVQPVIGQQLRANALLAVGLATLLMVGYLAIRFEWRFAVAAVLALLHDITLTIGLFSVFHLQVNSPFIAAVLTVYGYSMNDTVIVFDRIRERLRGRKRGESLTGLIDTSINQVLNRTINTVATVLLALLAVYIFGGGSTQDLALALLVGVSFGTYSSIYIASPIYLYFAEQGKRNGSADAGARSPRTAEV
ncbi:MAG TPA: protein translocase subunit SecF [Bacillota bacterium]|nr:protein translocase subunit SecF [Bacillota bacterium]